MSVTKRAKLTAGVFECDVENAEKISGALQVSLMEHFQQSWLRKVEGRMADYGLVALDAFLPVSDMYVGMTRNDKTAFPIEVYPCSKIDLAALFVALPDVCAVPQGSVNISWHPEIGFSPTLRSIGQRCIVDQRAPIPNEAASSQFLEALRAVVSGSTLAVSCSLNRAACLAQITVKLSAEVMEEADRAWPNRFVDLFRSVFFSVGEKSGVFGYSLMYEKEPVEIIIDRASPGKAVVSVQIAQDMLESVLAVLDELDGAAHPGQSRSGHGGALADRTRGAEQSLSVAIGSYGSMWVADDDDDN
jgi:hypothetical protein